MNSKVVHQIKDKAIWIVFVVLFAAFAIAHPSFLTPNNLFVVARQVSMFGIASIGMTFVILIAGIDLSTGSIISVVNVICAFLMVNLGVNMWVAILIALVASAAIGFINGFMVATIGMPAIIATFASQIVFGGVALSLSGGTPIFGFPDEFRIIGQGHLGPVPIPVIIMVICFALGSFILNKTYFGRYFYAVGGNEEAARLSGIRVTWVKYLTYTLAGLFAGLAGIVLLSRTNSAQPTAGLGFEFEVITCVVLGGVSISGGYGKFSNVIAGVLIIGILSNGMVLLNVSAFDQMIVKGIVLALAVGFDCLQRKFRVA